MKQEHKDKIRDGNLGKIRSQETKDKISRGLSGRKQTPEHIENNRKSHIGINKGIPMKEETKEKLRQINIGRKHTEETKLKISKQSLGKKRSQEFKDKRAAIMKGVPMKQETKDKIRKKNLGYKQSPEHREKNRKGHLGQTPWNVGISPKEEWVLQMVETKVGGFWYGSVNNDMSLGQMIRQLQQSKQWTRSVLERDQYKDVTTGKVCLHPEAHHIVHLVDLIKIHNIKTLDDAINCKDLWDINNGITLEYENHMKTYHPKFTPSYKCTPTPQTQ